MRRKAFTIVELLVVLIIISLLTGIVASQVSSVRKSSRDASRLSDVLLIGKALDQYASANRGIYPTSSTAAAQNRMCAAELPLDINLFPKKIVPSDPLPVTNPVKTTGCTSMLDGYTYHSRYNAPTPNSSYAKTFKAQYVIEVGLENEKSRDESTFKKPSELGAAATLDKASNRFRYLLVGPYCGDAICDK